MEKNNPQWDMLIALAMLCASVVSIVWILFG